MTTWKLGRAFFAGLILSSALAGAQTPPAGQGAPRPDAPKPAPRAGGHPSLKTQAEALSRAFFTGDWKKFAALTYPRVVQIAGGPEALADFVGRQMRQMESEGMKVLSYSVGEPEPATRIGEQLYAIVPTVMKMKTPVGVGTQESFLVGVSRDGGGSWTFLGGVGTSNQELLRVVLPEAAGKLKFPEVKRPTFEGEP